MLAVDGTDDAVATARAICERPLALYMFSEDKRATEKVLRECTSGGAAVNTALEHLMNIHLPFGGIGESGMGAYHGKRTFDCFTHSKAVLIKTNYLDIPSRYPPYNAFDAALLEWVQYPYPAWQLRIAKYVGLLLLLLWARSKLPTKAEFKMKLMVWAMKFMQPRG